MVGSSLLSQYIGKLFGGESISGWLLSLVTIATTTLSLPVSQAADYWGRRWDLIVTTACGCAGCIIISRANNMATVLGGFAVLGISYGNQSLLFAVVSEAVPRKHRPFVCKNPIVLGSTLITPIL